MTEEQFEKADELHSEIGYLVDLIDGLERDEYEVCPCASDPYDSSKRVALKQCETPFSYWELYEEMAKNLILGLKQKLKEREKEFAEM